MRITAGDPGAMYAFIFLDGKFAGTSVTEADEEGGWLDRLVLDADGHVVVEDDYPKIERVRGVVVVALSQAGWLERQWLP